MASLLPDIPLIFPSVAGTHHNDTKKVHLSQLMSDTGWGPATGKDNHTGRMVVGAESGGNPKAHNYCCWGLLQMNVLVHTGKYGIPSDQDKAKEWLENPINNLTAARALFEEVGGDWDAPGVIATWEGRANGSYKRFPNFDPMIQVSASYTGDVLGPAKDAAEGVSGTADAIANSPLATIVKALFDPSTYLRLGKGLLGGIFVILGVGMIVFIIASRVTGNTPLGKTVKTISKTAKKATP